MAQMATVSLTANTWTQITNADATSITFQNLGAGVLFIKGAVGATPPSNLNGALQYQSYQGELNADLGDLFPGVAGVTRVYAYSSLDGSVSVNHA